MFLACTATVARLEGRPAAEQWQADWGGGAPGACIMHTSRMAVGQQERPAAAPRNHSTPCVSFNYAHPQAVLPQCSPARPAARGRVMEWDARLAMAGECKTSSQR